MNPYIKRITEITILPIGEAIFHPQATKIKIDDEAAGEFLVIEQFHDEAKPGEIYIDEDNWPMIRDTIESMIADIKEHREEIK